MPEVTKLEINDVVYDLRDPSKAPDGYGLGGKSSYVADLNTALDDGWYRTEANTLNCPAAMLYASVHVQTRLATGVIQELTGVLSNKGCKLIRTSTDGGATWTEEWENPPMLIGVEYRTTRRYGGKPVYAKLFSYTLTEAISKTTETTNIAITHSIDSFEEDVDSFAYIGSYRLPFMSSTGAFAILRNINSTQIYVSTYNLSWDRGTTIRVEAHYTKASDA